MGIGIDTGAKQLEKNSEAQEIAAANAERVAEKAQASARAQVQQLSQEIATAEDKKSNAALKLRNEREAERAAAVAAAMAQKKAADDAKKAADAKKNEAISA